MSAVATLVSDYFFEAKPLWTGRIGAAGVSDNTVQTIPLEAATNLTEGNAYVFTMGRVDAQGVKRAANLKEVSIGELSGTNLINCTRGVEGTAQGFPAGTVVEILMTATHWNKLIAGLGVEHGKDGKHTSALVTTLKSSAAEINTGTEDAKVVTPKGIADSYIGGVYSSMARQAIINGNFDVWQRGTSFTAANGIFAADRWGVSLSADSGTAATVTVSRQPHTSGDIPNAFYYMRFAPDGTGTSLGNNSVFRFNQTIENGTRLLAGLNKKVTVSFWARASVAGKRMGYGLVQNYGTGGSPSAAETITGQIITLTSTWTKYTYTFTTNTLVGKTFGTANDDFLRPTFLLQWGTAVATTYFGGGTAENYGGNGTIDIAQVQLCAGDVALPFQPKSFNQELIDCQRYYERLGTGSIGKALSATTAEVAGVFRVPKRTTIDVALIANNPSIIEIGVSGRTGTASAISSINTTAGYKDRGFVVDINGFSSMTAPNMISVPGDILYADAEF